MTSRWNRQEIEMGFVREFSVHGIHLGFSLALELRAERMRLEILRHQRENRRFHDSGMTYREAYRECYGRVLDMNGERPVADSFVEDEEWGDELAY